MHAHTHDNARARATLVFGAAITLAYVLLALIAGLRAHSLALISEAGHNFTDFLALGLSWLGVWYQSRPADANRSFGYHRAGVLAALVNVATLGVITAVIVTEAIGRLRAPQAVATGPMLWVAGVGVVMNLAIAFTLEGGRRDVNIRAAFLHMMGDALATALVLVGALAIARTGLLWIDPALSLVIAGLIVASGWGVLRETLNILLEGTPKGMRSEQVRASLTAVGGVQAVHDLHIWSLGSNARALSAHVQIADLPPSESGAILARLRRMLAEEYHIHHATIQFESEACVDTDGCRVHCDEAHPAGAAASPGHHHSHGAHGHPHTH